MVHDVMAEPAAFAKSLEDWELDLSFDRRALRLPGSERVMDLAEQMKEQCRQAIREQRYDVDAGERKSE